MVSEAKALLKLWSIVLASLCYCYFIASKFPKGKFRLFSLLPIFALFTILPLSFHRILPTGITAFIITWLGNFKLLLFAFDLGPLSSSSSFDHQKPSLFKFILISIFPIKVKNKRYPYSQKQKNYLPFWSKIVISSILVGICDIYKGRLNQGLLVVIYSYMIYFFLDIAMGIINKIVGSVIGEELLPPSDEPYLSTSLREFWGRRWNLMVTDILRHTVYFPTRAFLSNYFYLDLNWASISGTMATFLISGLMHELNLYYMTRVSPTWELTWFFVLHGLCVNLEVSLKDIMGRNLGFHWAVTGPLTAVFVMGTGYLWFFPPLLRNQVDLKGIEEILTLYEFIKESFKKCF